MNWKLFIKACLKTLLLLALIVCYRWFLDCFLAGGKINLLHVALTYMITDTVIRYYEKYEEKE